MAEELTYKDEAAAGYERAFAHVSTHFVPFVLRAARLAPGMRCRIAAIKQRFVAHL
jgi:hypothetical protein